MNGLLPKLSEIKELFNKYQVLESEFINELRVDLEKEQKEFREKLQKMYESHQIEMYHIPETNVPLLNKILQSNNIREFHYD